MPTSERLMVRWSYARAVTADVTHHQFPASIIGPADDAEVYVHSRPTLHLAHATVTDGVAYRGRRAYRVEGVNDDGVTEVWNVSQEVCACSRQISATLTEEVPV